MVKKLIEDGNKKRVCVRREEEETLGKCYGGRSDMRDTTTSAYPRES